MRCLQPHHQIRYGELFLRQVQLGLLLCMCYEEAARGPFASFPASIGNFATFATFASFPSIATFATFATFATCRTFAIITVPRYAVSVGGVEFTTCHKSAIATGRVVGTTADDGRKRRPSLDRIYTRAG